MSILSFSDKFKSTEIFFKGAEIQKNVYEIVADDPKNKKLRFIVDFNNKSIIFQNKKLCKFALKTSLSKEKSSSKLEERSAFLSEKFQTGQEVHRLKTKKIQTEESYLQWCVKNLLYRLTSFIFYVIKKFPIQSTISIIVMYYIPSTPLHLFNFLYDLFGWSKNAVNSFISYYESFREKQKYLTYYWNYNPLSGKSRHGLLTIQYPGN